MTIKQFVLFVSSCAVYSLHVQFTSQCKCLSPLREGFKDTHHSQDASTQLYLMLRIINFPKIALQDWWSSSDWFEKTWLESPQGWTFDTWEGASVRTCINPVRKFCSIIFEVICHWRGEKMKVVKNMAPSILPNVSQVMTQMIGAPATGHWSVTGERQLCRSLPISYDSGKGDTSINYAFCKNRFEL